MNQNEPVYALDPTTFHSWQQAQEITNTLESNLLYLNIPAGVSPVIVETFSEIINNSTEHGMSEQGATAHVRFMPHRTGHALDAVIADSGPGVRTTLQQNPNIPELLSDQDALELAIQELVSGTASPNRGIGLWITVTEMQKPGRKLLIHSGSALLTMYGQNTPEIRDVEFRQGTLVRFTVPC